MWKREITDIEKILMERDGMTSEEAYKALDEARDRVRSGDDPEDVLMEDFGLEPDYFLDLL